MFTPGETPTRRRLWGVVYALVSLAGLSLLIPFTSPTEFMQSGSPFLYMCGALTALFFGIASFASFRKGRKQYWLENVASWFGNAGLVVFLFAMLQSVLKGQFSDVPESLVMLSLLICLVGRSWILQRYLKKEQEVRDVVRIAIRNDV